MKSREAELLKIGVVTGVHGLRGDLKVRPLSEGSSTLLGAREIFLASEGKEPAGYVPTRTKVHKGNVLMQLQGLDHIEAVQPLVGSDVLVPFSELEELPQGEYYWFDLEGLAVEDQSRGKLGTLVDLFSTLAHDIYVVQGAKGEILIPAIGDFILEIDLVGRRMIVDLPEGLVPEPDEI
jgi:16S rRNA processing protein RimM